jgi:hypothetical protein
VTGSDQVAVGEKVETKLDEIETEEQGGGMNTPSLRTLLEQVADGRLEPDLAAAMLRGGPAAPPPSGERSRTSPPRDAKPPVRVEVLVDALDLTVIADPSVERFSVEGALEVVERPDGVVELRLPTRSPDGEAYRFGAVGGLMAGWLQGRSNQLKASLRLPPQVPVSVATNASKVDVTGMTGGLNIRAVASAVRLQHVAGPLALDLQTSSAKGSALLAVGRSEIRGTMSSLDLHLDAGSNVRVSMAAELGSVKLGGAKAAGTGMNESVTGVVGGGQAELDVRMTMSGAKVSLP